MRLKTSGSDASGRKGGPLCRGGLWGGGGGSCGADSAPVAPVVVEADAGTGPGPSSLPAGGGEEGSATPPPVSCAPPPPPGPSRLASRRLGAWRFTGLGSLGPSVEEGRVPSVLGGALRRRVTGGPELGRACEAGRARPSQEDNAAAPARLASRMSTWRPSATRGGTLGQLGPAEEPVWPLWPTRQQRLMPEPMLLHRAHDGAPCSKQSAPCVTLPAPGGRLRCGAASGTLRGGARGGLRACGSRGGPPSRGRGK